MEVTFDYWTNLCSCGGGNVGGSCTMEMTEEEYILFKDINSKAKTGDVRNIIEYFEGKMPEELRERIDCEIYASFERQETESMIRSYGIDCFNNLSQEEYDEMTMDELIDRCIEDNRDGVLEYHIVEISFE